MCVSFFFSEANTRQLRNATQISLLSFFSPSFTLLSFFCNQKTKSWVSKANRYRAIVSSYNFMSEKKRA